MDQDRKERNGSRKRNADPARTRCRRAQHQRPHFNAPVAGGGTRCTYGGLAPSDPPLNRRGEIMVLTQRIAKNANIMLGGDTIDPEVAFLLSKDTNNFRDNLQSLI